MSLGDTTGTHSLRFTYGTLLVTHGCKGKICLTRLERATASACWGAISTWPEDTGQTQWRLWTRFQCTTVTMMIGLRASPWSRPDTTTAPWPCTVAFMQLVDTGEVLQSRRQNFMIPWKRTGFLWLKWSKVWGVFYRKKKLGQSIYMYDDIKTLVKAKLTPTLQNSTSWGLSFSMCTSVWAWSSII